MKRTFLLGAGVALVVALLSGFTLVTLSVQTPRARWTTFMAGQTAVRDSGFGGSFVASLDATQTVSYGPARWRTGGVECLIVGAGTTDGGTNKLLVDIYHEDGGVDCQCDLSSAACLGNASFACACPNGVTELGGVWWQMKFDWGSTCLTMPGNGSGYDVYCTADMFR